MPIFDAKCSKCGLEFEVMQKVGQEAPIACTKKGCKGKCDKLWGTPKFHLQGTGFHKSKTGLQ
tara:strand:- start:142 stop:330 length:189 start_codon:yes stop_codon:yes gene_type:complete